MDFRSLLIMRNFFESVVAVPAWRASRNQQQLHWNVLSQT